jgi:hypothetical protein
MDCLSRFWVASRIHSERVPSSTVPPLDILLVVERETRFYIIILYYNNDLTSI